MNKKSVLALLLVLTSINILFGMEEDSLLTLNDFSFIKTPFLPVSAKKKTDVCEVCFSQSDNMYKSIDHTGNDGDTSQIEHLKAFTKLPYNATPLFLSPDGYYGVKTKGFELIPPLPLTLLQIESIQMKIKANRRVVIYDGQNNRRYDISQVETLDEAIPEQIARANEGFLNALVAVLTLANTQEKAIVEKSRELLKLLTEKTEQEKTIKDLQQTNHNLTIDLANLNKQLNSKKNTQTEMTAGSGPYRLVTKLGCLAFLMAACALAWRYHPTSFFPTSTK
jgi:hypothetical protein